MNKNRKNRKPEENRKDLLNLDNKAPSEINLNLPFSSDKDEAYENLHNIPNDQEK